VVAWAYMKISQLSDQALLQQTLLLVKREKELLSDILLHLREVHKRRLFCDLGFGSLFQYCVKVLGYSEDQAYRRINALKLVKEMPEIQEQIASGELSLSTLSVAQSLFKTDATVDKKVVLKALLNKSKREAEKIVRAFSSKLPESKRELRLSLSRAQEEKWQAVKAKLVHCGLKEEEILEKLCDLFLAPKPLPKVKSTKTEPAKKSAPENAPEVAPLFAPLAAPPRSPASLPKIHTKTIPNQIRRQVREQSQNQCSNCETNYALEIDHRLPRALGGTHQPNNLRLLCKSCNQRAAIQIFGIKKMQQYLK